MSENPPPGGLQRGTAETDVRRHEIIQSDDVEYLGDGTVEIVTVRHRGEARETKRRSFEEWASVRCVRAARPAVRDHLHSRIDEPADITVGHGRPTPESEDLAVTVSLVTRLSRDGRTIREPTLTLDELVQVTPRTASATITLAERHHSCTVPVYARHIEFRED